MLDQEMTKTELTNAPIDAGDASLISDYQSDDPQSIFDHLNAHFTMQRAAFDQHPFESLEERRKHLAQLKALLMDNQEEMSLLLMLIMVIGQCTNLCLQKF